MGGVSFVIDGDPMKRGLARRQIKAAGKGKHEPNPVLIDLLN